MSSGIDLALELIAEIAGKKEAGKVQLLFEYFPKRTIYCNLKTSKALPPYDDTKDQTMSKYMKDIIRDEVQKARLIRKAFHGVVSFNGIAS